MLISKLVLNSRGSVLLPVFMFAALLCLFITHFAETTRSINTTASTERTRIERTNIISTLLLLFADPADCTAGLMSYGPNGAFWSAVLQSTTSPGLALPATSVIYYPQPGTSNPQVFLGPNQKPWGQSAGVLTMQSLGFGRQTKLVGTSYLATIRITPQTPTTDQYSLAALDVPLYLLTSGSPSAVHSCYFSTFVPNSYQTLEDKRCVDTTGGAQTIWDPSSSTCN